MGYPEGQSFYFGNLPFSSIWIPRLYLLLCNSSIPEIERLLCGDLTKLRIADWSYSTCVGLYWISTIFWNSAESFRNIFRKGLIEDDNKNQSTFAILISLKWLLVEDTQIGFLSMQGSWCINQQNNSGMHRHQELENGRSRSSEILFWIPSLQHDMKIKTRFSLVQQLHSWARNTDAQWFNEAKNSWMVRLN